MDRDEVFLETSGWIALLNRSDPHHAAADALWRQLGRGSDIVVTDWIIAETGNGLARHSSRSLITVAIRRVLTSPRARLVVVDEDLLARALDLFEARADKRWGLVDCASMLVMQDLGIRDVFGSDRHFAQAGLRCLLPLA
jgi:hypothetical protein